MSVQQSFVNQMFKMKVCECPSVVNKSPSVNICLFVANKSSFLC